MKTTTLKYLPEIIIIILIAISFTLLAQRPFTASEISCIHCQNMAPVSSQQDVKFTEIEGKEDERNRLLRYGLEKGVPNVSLIIFHAIERFKQ